MGPKGQIVIPKEIREKMQLEQGDEILVFMRGDAFICLMKNEDFGGIAKKMQTFWEKFFGSDGHRPGKDRNIKSEDE